MLDILDRRSHFSGTVNVTFPDDGILITGDGSDNHIVIVLPEMISGDPPLGLAVTSNDTQILYEGVLGSPSDFFTTTFGKPLKIDLGGGDDSIYFQGSYPGLIQSGVTTILTGDGNDQVLGAGSFAALMVDTGTGNDRVEFIETMVVSGNFSIFTGAGRDRISLVTRFEAGPQIAGKLWLQDMTGPTSIVLDKIYVRKNALISTGNSIDRVIVTNCSFRGSFILGTRAGDDQINLSWSVFRSTKDIFAGTGNNSIIP